MSAWNRPKTGSDASIDARSTRACAANMQQINRISSIVLIILSLTALLTVLSGYTQPPQSDEGTGAHIFQLSIVALVPITFLFLTTADWTRPSRSSRPLAFAAAAVALAFGALYVLEHYARVA
jgi:hypothetical protein